MTQADCLFRRSTKRVLRVIWIRMTFRIRILLIRTSGEQRLSNYLLWQLAYSEFYFTKVPWPDFSPEELKKAVEEYSNRDRRYGGLKEEE